VPILEKGYIHQVIKWRTALTVEVYFKIKKADIIGILWTECVVENRLGTTFPF
jgi:hypothetical protein